MKFGFATLMTFGIAIAAPPAFADRTDTLYENQSWRVQGITYDDGTYACLAEVADPGESFTIWTFADQTIRLQFYSEGWDFGDNGSANLEVEVDHRSPWSLTGANLTKQSVLFDLPDVKESINFVLEVAKGTTLHLRSSDGTPVKDYSLAGSAASINALVDCGTAISGSNSKNPFK